MAVPGGMVRWKGSVSDCLGHLQDKHRGLQYVTLKNIANIRLCPGTCG